MLIVEYGDAGPRVVLLQVLLNRKDAGLNVDGHFGPKTRTAVSGFQSSEHLPPTGSAGVETMQALFRGSGVKVVDAFDLGEPQFADSATITGSAGSTNILTGAMCNGVQAVVREAQRAAGPPGALAVLRFSGHGNLGRWLTFTVGEVVHLGREDPAQYRRIAQEWRSFIDPAHFNAMAPFLRPLRAYFAAFGSVEHHGCSLGKVPATRRMIQGIANLLGVPFTVGVQQQWIPTTRVPLGVQAAFRFRGPTFTAYPRGATLRDWSRSSGITERISR